MTPKSRRRRLHWLWAFFPLPGATAMYHWFRVACQEGKVVPFPRPEVVGQFSQAIRHGVGKDSGAQKFKPRQQRRKIAEATIQQGSDKLKIFLSSGHQFGGREIMDFQRPDVDQPVLSA